MARIHGQKDSPTLDLNFAKNKSLIDTMTGRNLVTFSRTQTGNGATYVGADGLIKYASANEPRFDHNPTTRESLGLLVEESRTNEITNSMPTTSGGTGITNTLVNDLPGSFSTGRRLTSSGGNDIRIVLGTNTLNVVFTYSFFARAGTQGSYIFLRNGTGPASAWNLNTKTVIKDDFGTAKIENYGNGWWRCYVTITGSGSSGFLLGVGDSGLNSVNGDNIIVAGVQLERGSFPTSYIPTEGSTKTRSADVASITGSNFSSWYNQSEGTCFISGKTIISGDYFFSFSDNTIANRIISAPPTYALGVFVGGGSVNISSTVQANANFKLATAAKLNSFNLANNGALGALNTSGVMPNGINRLDFFSTLFGTERSSGTISRLTYWPKRLPDTTLQRLTR